LTLTGVGNSPYLLISRHPEFGTHRLYALGRAVQLVQAVRIDLAKDEKSAPKRKKRKARKPLRLPG